MKKIFAVLLALCLLMSLSACGGTIPVENPTEITTTVPTTEPVTTTEPTTAPVEDDSISPLLYKVTDGEGNTAWLFGSIHVGQDYFYPLPDYVTEAAVKEGRLQYLTVEDVEIEIWKQMFHHRDKWVSPQMKIVMEYLTKK